MSRHHKSEKCLQDVQEKETNVHESIAFIPVEPHEAVPEVSKK